MKIQSLRWLFGGGALCLVVVLAVVLGSSAAGAHGVQVASDPLPNAQLQETPELISVTFNEPIEPSVSTIQLWDQNARQVQLGAPEFSEDRKTMTVTAPAALSPGTL